jgi:hypothetical protein
MGIFNRQGAVVEDDPFDVTKIGEELPGFLEPQNLDELAAYAPRVRQHRIVAEPAPPTKEEIKRVTAEAVASSHEAAAQALLLLGQELAENMKLIHEITTASDAAMRDCLDTAELYREAGRAARERIMSTMDLVTEVAETCKAMRDKLATPSS